MVWWGNRLNSNLTRCIRMFMFVLHSVMYGNLYFLLPWVVFWFSWYNLVQLHQNWIRFVTCWAKLINLLAKLINQQKFSKLKPIRFKVFLSQNSSCTNQLSFYVIYPPKNLSYLKRYNSLSCFVSFTHNRNFVRASPRISSFVFFSLLQ